MSVPVEITVKQTTSQIKEIADIGIFSITGDFKDWHTPSGGAITHFISKVDLKLTTLTGVGYNMFSANLCGDQLLEIHVAVVDSGPNDTLTFNVPTAKLGVAFSLNPNPPSSTEMNIRVVLYEIKKRPVDKFVHLCKIKTSKIVPPYAAKAGIKSVSISQGDPHPEYKDGNILIGEL